MDVLVVGAGIAGVACAQALRSDGAEVALLDRGRRVGGRMGARTVRLPGRADRVVDTGAAYMTTSDAGFGDVVRTWADRGLARRWTDTFHVSDGTGLQRTTTGPQRWAGTAGLRALVEDLAAGLDLTHPVDVTAVVPDAGHWRVDIDGGRSRAVPTVVLAMPEPQALALLPGEVVAQVWPDGPPEWSPTIAVCAQWEHRWWPERSEGALFHAAFVNDDRPAGEDTVRLDLVADDGRRRGDDAAALVGHLTAGSARPRLHDPETALGPGLAALAEALGVDGRPPAPLWTHVQRWSRARSVRERPAPPYALLADGLGVCGDGWGEASKVEGAWLSGTRLAAAIVSMTR